MPNNTSDNKSICECPEGYDELYHCTECDTCCFGWGTFTDKYADYMSRGKCAECAMKDGMTLEEMQYLVEQ